MTEADKAREPGFYWVREGDKWTVAEWMDSPWKNNMRWLTVGYSVLAFSADFTAIDERRIIREPSEDEMRVTLR